MLDTAPSAEYGAARERPDTRTTTNPRALEPGGGFRCQALGIPRPAGRTGAPSGARILCLAAGACGTRADETGQCQSEQLRIGRFLGVDPAALPYSPRFRVNYVNIARELRRNSLNSTGEGVWNLSSGDLSCIRPRITDIEYNRAAQYEPQVRDRPIPPPAGPADSSLCWPCAPSLGGAGRLRARDRRQTMPGTHP